MNNTDELLYNSQVRSATIIRKKRKLNGQQR